MLLKVQMESGIVYGIMGFVVVIGHEQLILLIMGVRLWDKYGSLSYLPDFAETWLKGVYMGQYDTPNGQYMPIIG